MYFATTTYLSRRTVFPAVQHFKPFAAFWRSQKTEAAPLERNQIFRNSAKIEIEDGGLRPFEDIPGPKKTFKSMVEFYRDSEGLTKLFNLNEGLFARYGPIFKENTLGQTQVHVMDPDDVEKVFRAEGKYPRRPLVDVWVEHRKRRNHFPGIANVDGEEWRRLRQSIAPKMMRPKTVEENIVNFNAVADDAIARFVTLKEGCRPDDHIPNLEGELSRFSTESIGTVAFDTRLGLYEDPPPQEALKFIDAAQNFFTLTQTLLFSIPSNMVRRYIDTPTLKKFFKVSDDIIEIGQGFVDKKMRELKEMAKNETEPSGSTQVFVELTPAKRIHVDSVSGEKHELDAKEPTVKSDRDALKLTDKLLDYSRYYGREDLSLAIVVSVLSYLLAKEELTPEEVNGHAIDVMLGGVDTTSNTLLWLLYHVGRLPHIQEKLCQEIMEVVGHEREISAKNIGRLSYLKACLKESMRMTPVIPVHARILDQDIVLSGYNVPAQTVILLESYCAARSEKYFKDPLEFKPERWLRENKDENHAFKSLPFGFGARMCLGRRVAELEMYMFLCKLLQRFRIEYEGEPLELYQKLICVPNKPVKIKLVDRL